MGRQFTIFKKAFLSLQVILLRKGIGQGRITKNLENTKDEFSISDTEALNIVYEMVLEGLILGGSSGINIVKIKLGKLLGKNKNIVTILCDYGTKY